MASYLRKFIPPKYFSSPPNDSPTEHALSSNGYVQDHQGASSTLEEAETRPKVSSDDQPAQKDDRTCTEKVQPSSSPTTPSPSPPSANREAEDKNSNQDKKDKKHGVNEVEIDIETTQADSVTITKPTKNAALASTATTILATEKEKHVINATTTVTHEIRIKDEEAEVEAEAEAEEQETPQTYLHGPLLYLLTFGLSLASFVVALDNTIIATAIPQITTQFDSLNDIGWYGSAYLLTTTSLQPSFGKFYTYFNVKWVYIIALTIFELGSVLCAGAKSSMMLILGRAVAGVGAAALYSGSMTMVGYAVALRQRAVYMSLLSSMFGIASVVGPVLGGVFTDRLSWRWCFWINLPFGAVTVAVVFFFFKNPPRPYANMPLKEKMKQIDLLGAFVLILATVCLVLALQWGGTVYPWSDGKVWGCILGFALFVMVFIAIQLWLKERATMPPHIFRGQRTVATGAIFSAFLAMALYGIIYYTPFYFQAIKDTTAEESGIRCIPFMISITLASIVGGVCVTGIGPCNPVIWVGSAIFVVGTGLLYTLQPNSGPAKWIGFQVVAGWGAGMCVQVPFIAVQVALSQKDMPVGTAITVFSNTLGGAISVSIAQNIFSNTLALELPKRAPSVDPEVVIRAGATHIRQVVSPDVLPAVLEAYNEAIVRTFIMGMAVGGIAFLSSFLMEWRSVKDKKKKVQITAVA